jgi:hypothetical protein
VKILVSKCTVFNINLLKCRPNSSELMTITTLFQDTELKQKRLMKCSRSNMRQKRRKPTTSSKEFSKPKRSSTSSIGHSSKLKSTMRS